MIQFNSPHRKLTRAFTGFVVPTTGHIDTAFSVCDYGVYGVRMSESVPHLRRCAFTTITLLGCDDAAEGALGFRGYTFEFGRRKNLAKLMEYECRREEYSANVRIFRYLPISLRYTAAGSDTAGPINSSGVNAGYFACCLHPNVVNVRSPANKILADEFPTRIPAVPGWSTNLSAASFQYQNAGSL